MGFIRTVLLAGFVDATTQPRRYPALLAGGCVLSVAGVCFMIVGGPIYPAIGVLMILAALPVLFTYAILAKNYGSIAIAGIVGLVAVCVLLLRLGDTGSAPRAELTTPEERAQVRAAERSAAPAEPQQPSSTAEPTTSVDASAVLTSTTVAQRVAVRREERPTTTQPHIDALQQMRDTAAANGWVFADISSDGRYYHEPSCPAVTARMQAITLTSAKENMLTPAWDCHRPK